MWEDPHGDYVRFEDAKVLWDALERIAASGEMYNAAVLEDIAREALEQVRVKA